jgi:hypothetical protein
VSNSRIDGIAELEEQAADLTFPAAGSTDARARRAVIFGSSTRRIVVRSLVPRAPMAHGFEVASAGALAASGDAIRRFSSAARG